MLGRIFLDRSLRLPGGDIVSPLGRILNEAIQSVFDFFWLFELGLVADNFTKVLVGLLMVEIAFLFF